VKRTLEIIILPIPRKKKEFYQTMENLSRSLRRSCSSLTIEESEQLHTITTVIKWETEDQMRQALKSEEFGILSGAISTLCESVIVRLNDQLIGNHISKISTL